MASESDNGTTKEPDFGQPSVIGKMELRQARETGTNNPTGIRLVDPLDMPSVTAEYRIVVAGSGSFILEALAFVSLAYDCAICRPEKIWSGGVVKRVEPHLIVVDDAIAQIRNNARAIKAFKQAGTESVPTVLLAADAAIGELKMMTLTSGADGVIAYGDGVDAAADQIKNVFRAAADDEEDPF